MARPVEPRFLTSLFSICDLQEKFRPAIYEYEAVIATTQKMLKAGMFLFLLLCRVVPSLILHTFFEFKYPSFFPVILVQVRKDSPSL